MKKLFLPLMAAAIASAGNLLATNYQPESYSASPPADMVHSAVNAWNEDREGSFSASTGTTTTVTAPTAAGFFGDLGQVGQDIWGDITLLQPFTTNSTLMIQVGGGVNTANARQGVLAVALTVPLYTAANGLGSFTTAVGCFGAYSGNGVWEDGAATAQIGQEWTVPVLGTVYQFAEEGATHNWKNGEYGNFAGTGIEKTWSINPNMFIGIGGLVANDSTVAGVYLLGGGHFTAVF